MAEYLTDYTSVPSSLAELLLSSVPVTASECASDASDCSQDACAECGMDCASDCGSDSCDSDGVTPIITPASFSITGVTSKSVTIYVSVGSSTEFIIYARTDDADKTEVCNVTLTKTSNFSYTISGLETGVDYAINVHYDNGNDWCGTDYFTTLALGPWEWWTTIEKGRPFVPPTADEWNAFEDHINLVLDAYGVTQRDFSDYRAVSGERMLASVANEVRSAIGWCGSDNLDTSLKPPWINHGDPLTAEHFHLLRDYLNSAIEAL